MLLKKNKNRYTAAVFTVLSAAVLFAAPAAVAAAEDAIPEFSFIELPEEEPVGGSGLPDGDAPENEESGEADKAGPEADFEAPELVIEASPIEPDSAVSPGLKTVFTREDIAAAGAGNVPQLISTVPGVDVSRQGSMLEPQTVSIRGASADHVLVLVDGKPLNSIWGGAVDIGAIPIDDIERLEIIRGGGTAVYGEGAVGGVLLIETRAGGRKAEVEAGYGFASFGTHLMSGRISGPLDDAGLFTASLGLNGALTRGDYVYGEAAGGTARLNNDGWTFSAAGSAGLDNGEAEAGLSLDLYLSDRGAPGLVEFLTPEARINEKRLAAAVSAGFSPGPADSLNFSLDTGWRSSAYKNPEDFIDEYHDSLSAGADAEWRHIHIAGDLLLEGRTEAEYGFTYLESSSLTDSTASRAGGEAVQNSAGLSFSVSAERRTLDLLPALRLQFFHQHYDAAEDRADLELSWSVSGGWSPFRSQTSEGPISLKANAASSFKNPSFESLYWPSGAFASGNPDLRPERGLVWDIGIFLDINETGFNAGAVFFRNRVKDLIQWLPSAGGVWRPGNIGGAVISGLEASVSYSFPLEVLDADAKIDAGYDWMRAEIDVDGHVNNGNILAYRPEHAAAAAFILKGRSGWSFKAGGEYTGYRFANNANTRILEPNLLLDASAGIRIAGSFHVAASVRNILNIQYIDRLGYPVPGIEWSVSGGYKL